MRSGLWLVGCLSFVAIACAKSEGDPLEQPVPGEAEVLALFRDSPAYASAAAVLEREGFDANGLQADITIRSYEGLDTASIQAGVPGTDDPERHAQMLAVGFLPGGFPLVMLGLGADARSRVVLIHGDVVDDFPADGQELRDSVYRLSAELAPATAALVAGRGEALIAQGACARQAVGDGSSCCTCVAEAAACLAEMVTGTGPLSSVTRALQQQRAEASPAGYDPCSDHAPDWFATNIRNSEPTDPATIPEVLYHFGVFALNVYPALAVETVVHPLICDTQTFAAKREAYGYLQGVLGSVNGYTDRIALAPQEDDLGWGTNLALTYVDGAGVTRTVRNTDQDLIFADADPNDPFILRTPAGLVVSLHSAAPGLQSHCSTSCGHPVCSHNAGLAMCTWGEEAMYEAAAPGELGARIGTTFTEGATGGSICALGECQPGTAATDCQVFCDLPEIGASCGSQPTLCRGAGTPRDHC